MYQTKSLVPDGCGHTSYDYTHHELRAPWRSTSQCPQLHETRWSRGSSILVIGVWATLHVSGRKLLQSKSLQGTQTLHLTGSSLHNLNITTYTYTFHEGAIAVVFPVRTINRLASLYNRTRKMFHEGAISGVLRRSRISITIAVVMDRQWGHETRTRTGMAEV